MIKWIVICIIGLIILGNLGIDVKKAIDAPITQTNLGYAKAITVYIWNKYLHDPVLFLWNEIIIKYVWSTAEKFLNKEVGGEEANTESMRNGSEPRVLFS